MCDMNVAAMAMISVAQKQSKAMEKTRCELEWNIQDKSDWKCIEQHFAKSFREWMEFSLDFAHKS